MTPPIPPETHVFFDRAGDCHIGIVGGGTAGWMSAATLKRRLGCRVTVVESSQIPSIGVGEATIPAMIDWLHNMGIDEDEFMRRTGATFKLGIRFDDWVEPQHRYWHPFGNCGGTIDGLDLVHHWNHAKQAGWIAPSVAYTDFSLQTRMCEQARGPRDQTGRCVLDNYAYHLDAGRLAVFLREIALAEGVEHRVGDVVGARCDRDGNLNEVFVENQASLVADLYIDCSGFASVLIDRAMHSGWTDWSSQLLCDRAVVCRKRPDFDSTSPLRPYTISTGMNAGWSWQIPLQENTGCGYVYSSAHIGDDDARQELSRLIGVDEDDTDFRTLGMRVGMRPNGWVGNCVAIGLSSGFIEPLESTGIFLVQRALDELVECGRAELFNARMNEVYCQTRDFVLMHYVVSRRRDTAFWRDAATVELPSSLARLLEVYQREGHVLLPDHAPTFAEANHHFILTPAGITPGRRFANCDMSQPEMREVTTEILESVVQQHHQLVAKFASHRRCLELITEPPPPLPPQGLSPFLAVEILCS
ncbi:tryptophan halogenase family protein [Neorhodopirellula pilleata]|nr:tryptophan halogenase family protein [Neorhodopirellula pilleata]